MHTALITGASSGIGEDIARVLAEQGNKVILVARRKERLEKLAKELGDNAEYVVCDLSHKENCFKLYEQVKGKKVDVLVNNAGFGVLGGFAETSLERELEMIETNVTAVHILTKLFLKEFEGNNKGHILNVASSAAFMAGPLFAAYYASKAYVLRLSQAINEEMHRKGNNVYISCLCPGPVKTEFDGVAQVKKSLSGLSSRYVAEKAVKGMLAKKPVIIPGIKMKLACLGVRLLPDRVMVKITYRQQKKKLG